MSIDCQLASESDNLEVTFSAFVLVKPLLSCHMPDAYAGWGYCAAEEAQQLVRDSARV